MKRDDGLYGPYDSNIMLLLATWRRETAQNLSKNAFDVLIKMLHKEINDKAFAPSQFPSSYYKIDKCEQELDTLVCFSLTFLSIANVLHLQDVFVHSLPEGGKLYLNDIVQVVEMMVLGGCLSRTDHHSHHVPNTLADLKTGSAWCNQEAAILAKHPSELTHQGYFFRILITNFLQDAIYLPLIVYSDEAKVLQSRGGQGVHPIRLVPATLPLEERLKDVTKVTVGYISKGASEAEALAVFCMYPIYVCDE